MHVIIKTANNSLIKNVSKYKIWSVDCCSYVHTILYMLNFWALVFIFLAICIFSLLFWGIHEAHDMSLSYTFWFCFYLLRFTGVDSVMKFCYYITSLEVTYNSQTNNSIRTIESVQCLQSKLYNNLRGVFD